VPAISGQASRGTQWTAEREYTPSNGSPVTSSASRCAGPSTNDWLLDDRAVAASIMLDEASRPTTWPSGTSSATVAVSSPLPHPMSSRWSVRWTGSDTRNASS
jgi:hypothetical protein